MLIDKVMALVSNITILRSMPSYTIRLTLPAQARLDLRLVAGESRPKTTDPAVLAARGMLHAIGERNFALPRTT